MTKITNIGNEVSANNPPYIAEIKKIICQFRQFYPMFFKFQIMRDSLAQSQNGENEQSGIRREALAKSYLQ